MRTRYMLPVAIVRTKDVVVSRPVVRVAWRRFPEQHVGSTMQYGMPNARCRCEGVSLASALFVSLDLNLHLQNIVHERHGSEHLKREAYVFARAGTPIDDTTGTFIPLTCFRSIWRVIWFRFLQIRDRDRDRICFCGVLSLQGTG